MSILKTLRRELIKLESVEKTIKMEQSCHSSSKQGKQFKTEKLSCKNIRGFFQYYINSKYVSKRSELPRIKDLAVAEYRKVLLPLVERKIRYLKLIMKTEEQIEKTYTSMYEGKRVLFKPDIVPVTKLVEEFEEETYNGLAFDENDHTEYFTNRGERVRSKSEKIIADELDRWGIPYKYEKPLALNINGKIKEFYPDFTAMNKTTGEIKYVEHLGMMDHPNYYQNVLAKLDAYEKNGLLIGRDVILLHESAYRPLNTRVIADYIEEFLT